MKHPYENIIRIEIIAIVLGVLLGMFAIVKGYYFLLYICFYLIAVSFLCESVVAWNLSNSTGAGKQFFRAIMILVFTTYLLLKL